MARSETENWKSFQDRIADFSWEDRLLVDYAYQLAKAAHRGQSRDAGERYFEHVRAVPLIILDEFKLRDPNLVMAALLHDVGEDTSLFGNPIWFTNSQWRLRASTLLTRTFNHDVSEMVMAVTRPRVDGVEVLTKQQADELSIEYLVNGPTRSKLLKASDRTDNLRTIWGIKNEERVQRKFAETREKYYPVFLQAQVEYPEIITYAMSEMELAMNSYPQT